MAVAAGTAGAAIVTGIVSSVGKVGDWLRDIANRVWRLFMKLGDWFMAGVKWLGARIRDVMSGAKDAVKGLVALVTRVLRAAWRFIAHVASALARELLKLIRWYMRLLAEKPEVGLTATLLFLYLLS